MNSMTDLNEKLVNEYSLMLLRWAYKKVGDPDEAQELVQNVWLEVFHAVKRNAQKEIPIQNPEHFIRKIAHYVWCHYLRFHTFHKTWDSIDELELSDGTDFVSELSNREETAALIVSMRKKIANLNYLQREIMISFYIDGRSQREIARRLNITESTVKWHLFDTRKKLKEEINIMNNTDFVYRPRTLHMALSGWAPSLDAINTIKNSLTKQNICLQCYRSPKTLDELADNLGIPKAYLEFDLKWLVENEFMTQTRRGYSTTFMIGTAQDDQNKYAVYLKHKEALSDVIINELIAAEDKIRAINFYGSDKPLNELLWLLIYRFCSYQKVPCADVEAPIRPDGGRYFPLGFDRSDIDDVEKVIDTTGWAFNGPMWNDVPTGSFYWFGLYNFGASEMGSPMCLFSTEWKELNETLCAVIHADFQIGSFDEKQKFALAKLAEKNFIRIEGPMAYPNFCIFTEQQYQQLKDTVYAPIAQKLEKEIELLVEDLAALCREKIPPHLSDYHDVFLHMAMYDRSYLTTIFAFNENKLYVPKDLADGEFLTMMYIRR